MNIGLFRIYSVPIRISTLELHYRVRAFSYCGVARGDHVPFHDLNSVVRHVVATTCHLRRLFILLCIIGGTYIYVPIYVHTIKDTWYKVISLLVPEVGFSQFYFLFDWPGMSFVEGIVCPQASQTCCDSFHCCIETIHNWYEISCLDNASITAI